MSDAVATDGAAPPAAPQAADVSPGRLLAVLGIGGAVAGVLLVVVFFLTLPAIEANRAKDLQEAVGEVLKGPARYDTLYVVNNTLVKDVPNGTDKKKLEQVYLGYGPADTPVGFAIVAEEPGFQDLIRLIVGYDPKTRKLIAFKVLESKETPGLGDRIVKDQKFIGQFTGAEPPLVGIKGAKRSNAHEVVTITGATISSRAVVRIINNAVKRLGPMLETYPNGSKG